MGFCNDLLQKLKQTCQRCFLGLLWGVWVLFGGGGEGYDVLQKILGLERL